MDFYKARNLVRDQEVDGSNPFAPTNLLEPTIYRYTNSRGAPGRGPGRRRFESICNDRSFCSQINALRCVLNSDFYFIFADNADNISGFIWKFEAQPKHQIFF